MRRVKINIKINARRRQRKNSEDQKLKESLTGSEEEEKRGRE